MGDFVMDTTRASAQPHRIFLGVPPGKEATIRHLNRFPFHTYLLLTEFEVSTVSYGPSFFPFDLWPQREVRGPYIVGEKRGSVTYSTDGEDAVSKIFIISLLCV